MKSIKKTLFVTLLLATLASNSQTYSYANSVLVTATVQTAPLKITLSWPTYTASTGYTVYRKTPLSTTWGSVLATLSGTATSYVDNTVTAATLYEYNVRRTSSTSVVIANGYLLSGIETNLAYNKGTIILLVDNFFVPTLNNEIKQLIKDYENDGWFVKTKYINRTDLVSAVKSQVISAYNLDPLTTKGLMLLGHIPVPYSGDNNPDGHPDHKGAWPADIYYGDIDGIWSDLAVSNSTATDPRNHNIIGDGKFDDDAIPSELELEVGRVDFFNLPAFSNTETQLMKKYLDKLHSFKIRNFIPIDKAVVEDNFTGYPEGFAGSGYTSFAPMFGPANTIDGDYTTALLSSSHLWSYGTGAGNYTSASGIVSTTNFATDSLKSIFTMLFGSYFGDWDSQNNLLRSALASGSILSSSWGGRPYWHYHQMAMGEDLGHCAQTTQNNNGTYFSSTLGCWCGIVSVAQMGDPSLRMHYIVPPTNLIAINNNATGSVALNWSPSSETVLGYNIYRRDTLINSWTKLNSSPIATTTYTDNTITAGGGYSYMVRATRLQTTSSGTYYNLSLGCKSTISSVVSLNDIEEKINYSIFPNPFENSFYITPNQNQSKVNITISDILGKHVYDKEVDFIQNENIQLNLTQLDAGIYFITINNKSYKIIKNK